MGKTVQRNFRTFEGRNVELIGPPNKVQIWIDSKQYMIFGGTVNGLHRARRIAVDYSRRHGS
jgi:hypothetical protein